MIVMLIGCGLIGSQIVRELLESDMGVVVYDRSPMLDAMSDVFDVSSVKIVRGDVLNVHDLYRVIRDHDVTNIVHMAANQMLTAGAQKCPYEALLTNVVGTANVLEACRTFDLERLVVASSNVVRIHVKDSLPHGTRPATIYASTKLFTEHLCYNYHDMYGIDFIALRFAATFGPWRYVGGGAPTRSFAELIDKVLRGLPAKIPRTGEYVYSNDTARACIGALKALHPNRRIYDIGMCRIYTSEEIAEIVKSIVPGCVVDGEGCLSEVPDNPSASTNLMPAR
ncbi:MAG: NAD(P)-dependent oxidoreductase [Thaumarchaeota archaeon]|nr:NAD(P)-dependent oxidoreductase [Candidatus Calditenuaceae archaeon]MDW8042075.1 NAD(P)-dependent oxidoreductase [Nitrososphaerota archaeon]